MKVNLAVVSMSDNLCLSEGGDYSAFNLVVSWPMAEIKGTCQGAQVGLIVRAHFKAQSTEDAKHIGAKNQD